MTLPPPPEAYSRFVERFPGLGDAWRRIADAGRTGPIDERTARLIKLAVAIGCAKEGAVHASARKARALGIPADEIEQVVALAAGTIGLPGTVAAYTWVRDVLEP